MAIIDLLTRQKAYDLKVVGSGAGNGATVSVVEDVDASKQIHKATITLTDTPVEVVSVSTGNGVGGVKIYDMPSGMVKIINGAGHLSLDIAAAKQADFTDGTPEGDIGLGTVAPANADALGTDATDDNILTATAFVGSAYADADIDLPFDAEAVYDGTESAMDVYLNVLVDAADIDDGVTTEVLISGTITLIYQNLGDL